MAYRYTKAKTHGNTRWTKEKIEAILADIKGGMKRGDAAKKHGITHEYLTVKIDQYNAGELK